MTLKISGHSTHIHWFQLGFFVVVFLFILAFSMTWSHLKYISEADMTQQYHLPWPVVRFVFQLGSLLTAPAALRRLTLHYMKPLSARACAACAFLSKMSYLTNAGPQKVLVTVMAAFIRLIFRSCLRHFCCMVFSFFLRILTCPSRCLILFCWARSLSTSRSLFVSSAV